MGLLAAGAILAPFLGVYVFMDLLGIGDSDSAMCAIFIGSFFLYLAIVALGARGFRYFSHQSYEPILLVNSMASDATFDALGRADYDLQQVGEPIPKAPGPIPPRLLVSAYQLSSTTLATIRERVSSGNLDPSAESIRKELRATFALRLLSDVYLTLGEARSSTRQALLLEAARAAITSLRSFGGESERRASSYEAMIRAKLGARAL
jgi:hypothetical protein